MIDTRSDKESVGVLLIDSDPDVQLALTDFLEAQGYRVRSVASGAEAITALNEGGSYATVLLDLALPDMDGISLLKTFPRFDPHLPVIVITGQVEVDLESQAFRHGAVAFIKKPYNREQLLALLSRAVEVRKLGLKHVEVEQALKDSEKRFQLTIDHISDGVFYLDLSGVVIWANQQGALLLDRHLSEVIGHSFMECLSPEAAALAESRLATIRAGGTVSQVVELKVRRPAGTERWIEANVTTIVRHEKVSGRLLIGRDISARKQAELDLVERNRLLELDIEVATNIDQCKDISNLLQGCAEALVRHLDAAFVRIWCLDDTTQVLQLHASAGLYTHLDWPHSRVPVGQYKIGLIAAEGKPILTNEVIGDSRIPEQEWANREGLVAFAGYPLLSNQKVLGVMALFARHPLTEFTLKSLAMVAQRITVAVARQKVTDEKNTLTVFNQRLLASAGEGIYGVDLDGNTTFVNPSALNMTGYEEGQLLGQAQHALLHHSKPDGSPYPQEECPIYAAFKNGSVYHVDTEVFWRKDGSSFPVQFTSTPIRNGQGELEGAVVTVQDITTRKQQEALLDTIYQAQSQFIGTTNPSEMFENLLINLLSLTQSEYGFLGEILSTPEGQPYLKTQAITNIAWNQETRELYDRFAPNLEFFNLKTLFGAVITTGQPVLSNDPINDPRGGGQPIGHPPLRAFLGLPFYYGDRLVGMAGIANRPGGYDEEIIAYLQPLLVSCGTLIEACRNQ
jgi:PAS domain S-box-containing protein